MAFITFNNQYFKKSKPQTQIQKDNSNLNIDKLKYNQKEEERLLSKNLTPFEVDGVRQKEKINLITFLNCLKFLSPIYIKTKEIAGNEDFDLQSEYISEHSRLANVFALKVLEKLELPVFNNRWLINSLERIYIEEIISKNNLEKITNIDLFFEEKEIDFLIEITKKAIEKEQFINENEDVSDSIIENVELRLSIFYIKSINEISKTIKKYNPFGNDKFIFEKYTKFLNDLIFKFFDKKIKTNSLLTTQDKLNYFVSVGGEINKIFIENWILKGRELYSRFNNNNISKEENEENFKSWKSSNQLNQDLNEIFSKTEKDLESIFELVSIVLPNRTKNM